MKSRLELETEITTLLVGRDLIPIFNYMLKKYRVREFYRLTVDQLEDLLKYLRTDTVHSKT
jgi:hypothetical protein